jgi:hypothetical protein
MSRPLPASSSPAPRGSSLDRRQFLTYASSGFAAAALGSLPGLAHAREALSQRPLSVGYMVGSDELPGFDAFGWSPHLFGADPAGGSWISPYGWEVVPAQSLPLGDQGLAHETIEVRVHGLYPSVPGRRQIEGAHLDVLFPPPPEMGRDAAKVPFFAWSFQARPALDASPPVCFIVPLEGDGGLDLRLTVRPGVDLAGGGLVAGRGGSLQAEPWNMATRFTVDWEAGLPRLKRGVYLLGLAPETWKRAVTLPGPEAPERMDLCSVVLSVDRWAPAEEE